MPYTKTAVSIESRIFAQGEDLAHKLGVSRSELYTRALQALIRQRGIRALQERIDAANVALSATEHGAGSTASEDLHRAASATMRRSIERGDSTW